MTQADSGAAGPLLKKAQAVDFGRVHVGLIPQAHRMQGVETWLPKDASERLQALADLLQGQSHCSVPTRKMYSGIVGARLSMKPRATSHQLGELQAWAERSKDLGVDCPALGNNTYSSVSRKQDMESRLFSNLIIEYCFVCWVLDLFVSYYSFLLSSCSLFGMGICIQCLSRHCSLEIHNLLDFIGS